MLRRALAFTAAGMLVASAAWVATPAASASDSDCRFDPTSGKYFCGIEDPGNPGGGNAPPSAGGGGSGSTATPTGTVPGDGSGEGSGGGGSSDKCEWLALDPQPSAGDPRWEGQDPATHVVMLVTCLIGYQLGTDEPVYEDHYEVVEKGSAPPRVLPAPDPAVLAASAWAQMPLPKPGVHRSPSESNHDPAHGNLPFTWVNLPTWFWADAGVWAPQTLTVSLRGVSVTATGVPVSLTYTPGDGGTPAVCDGPGRAWTEADGNAPPAAGSGGCAYTYRDVTANGPITSSVSLTWRGSWTSNTGASGSLGEVTVSSTSAPFLVEQIQVMLR